MRSILNLKKNKNKAKAIELMVSDAGGEKGILLTNLDTNGFKAGVTGREEKLKETSPVENNILD